MNDIKLYKDWLQSEEGERVTTAILKHTEGKNFKYAENCIYYAFCAGLNVSAYYIIAVLSEPIIVKTKGE